MPDNYIRVIRDLTPAEICEHYNKIVAEKDKEIERLEKLRKMYDGGICYNCRIRLGNDLAELAGKKEDKDDN